MRKISNVVVVGGGTSGLVCALHIKQKYPLFNVTVVKSGDIGIVGVGEGSTEHWSSFMNFVEMDHLELIYKTKATVKIGILFKNWSDEIDEYVHSLGSQARFSKYERMDNFYHLLKSYKNKKFPLAPFFEEIYYNNNVNVNEKLLVSNQFHFDTFKLNDFLVEFCSRKGIKFIDDVVSNVVIDEQGYVSKLEISEGHLLGDFFIDCSGFRRVIASKVGCKWISKKNFLPVNHAIAFPTEKNGDSVEPYTLSQAMDYGWMWRIPTQERYGNGYVFSDMFINSDEALNEVNKKFNFNVEKVARDIKFEAGSVDNFWMKNVVCIGLSGSFCEPLEAQSIGFTIVQSMVLLDYLDSWVHKPEISNDYNKILNEVFDNIVDYLQLHYLGEKQSSIFWNEKPFKLTDFNREFLPLFKRGLVEKFMFRNNHLMFKHPNFFQVLAGLNLIDVKKMDETFSFNRPEFNSLLNKLAMEDLKNNLSQYIIPHSLYFKLVNQNFENNLSNSENYRYIDSLMSEVGKN